MKYLEQLNEVEIVELINFCIRRKNEKIESEVDKQVEINFVTIYNEENRIDEHGERYVRVETSALYDYNLGLVNLLYNYLLTDFSLKIDRSYHFKDNSYDEELKEFMALRFGESYLQDLFNLRLENANVEYEKLNEYIRQRKNK